MFTSLHIPEDDHEQYRKRLRDLGAIAKRLHLTLMVDISSDALEQAGFSLDAIEQLLEMGVTGLRIDDQIDNQTIATLSHQITIGLNASTITPRDIFELQQAQADFSAMEAWHNYYPRPETGLDTAWYQEKNNWLNAQGFQTQAFIAGNKHLRGPLREGLPTLEAQRYLHPLAACLELQQLATDHVYLGDEGLTAETLEQFLKWQQQQILALTVEVFDSTNEDLFLGQHPSRLDTSRDVIRSASARFKQIDSIKPMLIKERPLGTVTLDNQRYLRYMGEIQITKTALPLDEKVNVVARVVESDHALLPFIKDGRVFELKKGIVEDDKAY